MTTPKLDSKALPHDNSSGESFTYRSRCQIALKFAQTALIYPVERGTLFAFRLAKLFTWAPIKTTAYLLGGFFDEADSYFKRSYLKTVQVARDLLFIPSLQIRTLKDLFAKRTKDTSEPSGSKESDLKCDYVMITEQYHSYLYGTRTLQAIKPAIKEFPATSAPDLLTVMATHMFGENVLAINFGMPNVASFVTKNDSDQLNTYKVDAKSLKRQDMTYHPTNGKIQSGVFLAIKNLPAEAIDKFNQAATNLAKNKTSNITCVNTNARVLKEAGFSIEGVEMEDIIFPQTLFEHLIYRKVYFKGEDGQKVRVDFNVINTSKDTLEQHFAKVDTAVVGTRFRHALRNKDTPEAQKIRSDIAKKIIQKENDRIDKDKLEIGADEDLSKYKLRVSVPSFLGRLLAKGWGKHTIYEVCLNEKTISEAGFEENLTPFANSSSTLLTKLKKHIFFSPIMIRFIRRHMVGRMDEIMVSKDMLQKHLKSTNGDLLNYAVLDDKIVFSRVNTNKVSTSKIKKVVDWALSKHALIAGRRQAKCAGEIWYDTEQKNFKLNINSGTYTPLEKSGKKTVALANAIFGDNMFNFVSPKGPKDGDTI